MTHLDFFAAQDYRHRAERAERLADAAAFDEDHRLTILKIAAAWREFADHQELIELKAARF
jgi:hypothetical protein